ncbi:hypothetical protein AZF37_01545 [endosymbiont 'TC1' of Trimyema compressum]|uniref:Holliday junction branch migration protein RuvA n=1 Tax=endosymbiont 'TC1' of Trimyema compressum TaxID=243899 RepID=UPI0007F17F1D|nr:Holliday junction branch migration protein RuvA [endosymbiont 'TC1' of Trimyema compressum]AMP20032.1 hypothetical protein AZF37_01545 [endosymbiont 'TC1' of Trimyema compressum]
MIGFLKGNVFKKKEQSILLDVRDVGYEVFLTVSDLTQLKENENVLLFIHYKQKEDGTSLFGFMSEETKDVFEVLIDMNGIGPKMGMVILSAMDKDMLIASIQREDVFALTEIPGVGKKTAQRMIVELQDKLNHYVIDDTMELEMKIEKDNRTALTDAEEALIFLGYSKKEIDQVLKKLLKRDKTYETDDLIKLALKELGK